MLEAAYKFDYVGAPVKAELYGDGHINRTYLVETDAGRKYILQGLNTVAFHDIPGLMENIIAVTSHIASRSSLKDSTLHFLKAFDGKYYYESEDGGFWRSYDYVDNCIGLQRASSPEEFRKSAVAFGTFQNLLSDFPADTLHETIPNFHNTPDRYRIFHNSLEADAAGRRALAEPEIEFVLGRESSAGELQGMRDSGELPLRVTHNDTKLNNVLFSESTQEPVCVIDLDTVMPGLSAYDFGDSIRFGASTAAEDETDLSKVSMSLDMFKAFAEGFVSSCPGLTRKEIEVLPLGAKTITLEIGLRFLTDFLDGDVYFRTAYPEHNLVRARTQFKLVADMEEKWAQMQEIVANL